MKLKITIDVLLDLSDEKAAARYGTTDVYSTAQAMTREAAEKTEELKRDMTSDGSTAEHVGVVVIPLHG